MRGAAGWRRSLVTGLTVLAVLAGCSGSDGPRVAGPSALDDDVVTVASFDFPESELLAEIYGQALEGAGIAVEQRHRLGPRELVAPAMASGLVELVPEYVGTATQFVSVGTAAIEADPAASHRALQAALAPTPVMALAASPAQDANTFVVTGATAREHGLRDLSDLRAVASGLAFGGPPECPSRPLCLGGLQTRYDLRFGEFVSLDAGGSMTHQALRTGLVDVALVFSTDPDISAQGWVVLRDDRALQPAENVTPLVRRELVARFGSNLVDTLDGVSAQLSTDALRDLNGQVQAGRPAGEVAAAWLAEQAASPRSGAG